MTNTRDEGADVVSSLDEPGDGTANQYLVFLANVSLGGMCLNGGAFQAMKNYFRLTSEEELWAALRPLATEGLIGLQEGSLLIYINHGGWEHLSGCFEGQLAIAGLEPVIRSFDDTLTMQHDTVTGTPPEICATISSRNLDLTDAGQVLALIYLGCGQGWLEFENQGERVWVLRRIRDPYPPATAQQGPTSRSDPGSLNTDRRRVSQRDPTKRSTPVRRLDIEHEGCIDLLAAIVLAMEELPPGSTPEHYRIGLSRDEERIAKVIAFLLGFEGGYALNPDLIPLGEAINLGPSAISPFLRMLASLGYLYRPTEYRQTRYYVLRKGWLLLARWLVARHLRKEVPANVAAWLVKRQRG